MDQSASSLIILEIRKNFDRYSFFALSLKETDFHFFEKEVEIRKTKSKKEDHLHKEFYFRAQGVMTHIDKLNNIFLCWGTLKRETWTMDIYLLDILLYLYI